MNILKKIYPRNGAASYMSTTTLVLIAEGYTAAQESQFHKDVDQAYKKVIDYCSLINLKLHNNSISLYTLFIPSLNSGIATSAAGAVNRTVFESYITSGKLYLNYNKVKAVLEDSYFNKLGTEDSNLKNKMLFFNEEHNNALNLAIPIFIFPKIASQVGELENQTENQYYFVATTLENFYEQVILRALFKILGLGDEFDLSGTEYLEPNEEIGVTIDAMYPNLLYSTDAANIKPTDENFKWNVLFTSFNTSSVPVHPHPGAANTPDRTFPSIPFSYKTIELWEGGGGYRKKIYRAAHDCLLRRKIGDTTLPVKTKRVALCPICELSLNKLF